MKEMKEAFKRAVRTAAQAFVGAVATAGIPAIADLADVRAAGGALAFAAVTALVVGLVSLVHNLAEDNTPLPSIFK